MAGGSRGLSTSGSVLARIHRTTRKGDRSRGLMVLNRPSRSTSRTICASALTQPTLSIGDIRPRPRTGSMRGLAIGCNEPNDLPPPTPIKQWPSFRLATE
jgi:hypothetical protein